MEDVLEVYKRRYDPKRPLICMDEIPKQLLADLREPLPIQPGLPERTDYEYQRNGVADLFMLCEPLVGKRYMKIADQRRRLEWSCSTISTPIPRLPSTWLISLKKPGA
jgi:hypothetical protein